ncbi:MAG: hypothetical protein SGILL_008669, partial [Bacillariaceae sp.]
MKRIDFKNILIAGWITLIQLSCASALLCSERTSHRFRPIHDEPSTGRLALSHVLHKSRSPCRISSVLRIGSDESDIDGDSGDENDENNMGRFRARAASIMASVQATMDRLRRPFFRNKLNPNPSDHNNATITQRNNWTETSENSTTCSDVSTKSIEPTKDSLPFGSRWEVAHPDVDISGTWKPIITPEFLKKYDEYLANCGSSYFFRQLCLKFCGTTRETITQQDHGRTVELDGRTPAGNWKRSLISSGASPTSPQFQVAYAEFLDPDKERVQVEAWWENDGSVHHSILRNKQTVGGGEFETLRYLSDHVDDGDANNDRVTETKEVVLVTESTFHPSSKHLSNPSSSNFKPAHIRW